MTTAMELNKRYRQASDAKAEHAYHLLRQGDSEGLDAFFELYYSALALTALRLLNNTHDAENAAQNAFVRLWHRRQKFNSAAAVKTFLYRCVLESCQRKTRLRIGLQPKVRNPLFKALLEALVVDRLVNVKS